MNIANIYKRGPGGERIGLIPKDEYIENSMKEANIIREKLIKENKADKNFKDLEDDKKFEWIRISGHTQFQIDFPIICKYMVCLGLYHPKAFSYYLKKSYTAEMAPKPISFDKEDAWRKLQADYVKYLCAATSPGGMAKNLSKKRCQLEWQNAYDCLKKEYEKFQENYKNAEALQKEKNEKFKKERAVEFTEAVKKSEVRITGEEKEQEELFIKLQFVVSKQFKDACTKSFIAMCELPGRTVPHNYKRVPGDIKNPVKFESVNREGKNGAIPVTKKIKQKEKEERSRPMMHRMNPVAAEEAKAREAREAGIGQ